MKTNQIYVDPAVSDGTNPVLFAWRSPENKLFLLGEKPLEDPAELLTEVSLESLIDKDASLKEISDLPSGFRAYRSNPEKSWKIAQFNTRTGQGKYLDGYLEWMNKMYVDGYFTGGTVPHFYTYPGRPRLYGWASLLIGFIMLAVSFILVLQNHGSRSGKLLGPGIAGLLFVFIGSSLLIRNKRS